MRRLAVLLALVGGLAGCGGARGHASAAAAPRSAAGCATIGRDVRRFTEAMELASLDAKSRVRTSAGLLAYLVALDDAATSLDGALAAAPGAGEVGTRVSATRAALGRAITFARAERGTAEKRAKDVAPLARETQAAWGALRAACDRRGTADCTGVRAVVAHFDTAATRAEHEKAVAELVALKLSPSTGRLRDRAVAASRSVQTALKGQPGEPSTLPQRLVTVQKDLGDAVAGIVEACRAEPAGSDLVVAAKPDPRRLTVLVHVHPPPELEKTLRGLAREADDPDDRSFYEGRAEGTFGSGFVLVRRDGGVHVVTNRHVVELGERAELALADGTPLGDAEVVYANATYDLAVLRPLGKLPVTEGFALADVPARDQQTVIATGFPGIVGKPSYQTTRGYVSNESFVLDDGTRPLTYVQHTAPIDPGSSGGPLTDEGGRVLGVNTLKVTGREAVGLAVPARFVASTLGLALESGARRAAPETRLHDARLACLGLLGELGAAEPRPLVLEQMIANRLVAAEGLDDAMTLAHEDGFEDLWSEDVLRAMRIATVVRLRASFQEGGGPSALELCDDAEATTADEVTFRVRLGSFATRRLVVRAEHGRWKVAAFDAGAPTTSTPATARPSPPRRAPGPALPPSRRPAASKTPAR